jgi:hypothetical protein
MRLLVPLLLAAAVGCGGDRAPARGGIGGAGPAVDPGSVPGRGALELWQLRGGVTLGAWATAHPEESIAGEDTSREAEHLGEWCAVSSRAWTLGPRTLERRAYFYPPAPAADLALPDSAPDLIRSCTLGLVWVSVPAPDSAAGTRLADSVRSQVAAVFPAESTAAVSFWGSAYWTRVGRFRRDSVAVVTAFATPPTAPGDSGARGRRVIAFAYLPSAGIAVDPASAPGPDPYTPVDTFPLDSAARSSGLDTALWRPLRAILHLADRPGAVPAPADSLIRPLRRWLNAAAGMPASRRAAALYVADQVLARTRCLFRACAIADSAALAPLRALGATFGYSALGATWVYERTWLLQARALDRDSPLGQRILLEQMALAFDYSGMCREGPEGFRRVIETGERYLERVPDSPVAAEVRWYLGEAYRDIVALAGGAQAWYADASRYAGEAPGARRRAVEQYRAAIRAGAGGPTARAAWRRAWWLLAGLMPRDVRFLCVYD